MKYFLFITLSLFLFSCENNHKNRSAKIHCYQTGSLDDNTFLYWYILYGQHNTYYVYSSSTPVTNFSNASWIQENSLPTAVSNVPESGIIEEPLTELPNEIEVEMESQSEATESNSESNSSESTGESNGGDSGNGDASGGDSGGSSGGDGGGGD